MKLTTYATIMTVFAIVSFGGNGYFLKNSYNVSQAIERCSKQNDVHLSSCKVQVVNTSHKETDAQKLTLLLPPELQ